MSSTHRNLALAVLAIQQAVCLAASPGDASTAIAASQICTADGAFGVRIGEPGPVDTSPSTSDRFDRGCVLFKPKTPHPLLSTYAVCISEFDNKVYQIQAATLFDTQPPKGSLSLTPAQRKSNQQRGQHALDELLKLVPANLSAQVVVNPTARSWKVEVDKGVTLELSNFSEWLLSFECRNEAMALDVFNKRIQGVIPKYPTKY